MTPEAQRISIAKACPTIFKHDGRLVYWHTSHEKAHRCVDPLSDLNAVHEAEKVLSQTQREAYWDHLLSMCGHAGMVFATAAQRAEAFLRTLGLFQETNNKNKSL